MSRCPRRFVCLLAVPVANQVDVVEVEEVRGEGQSGESISLAVVSAAYTTAAGFGSGSGSAGGVGSSSSKQVWQGAGRTRLGTSTVPYGLPCWLLCALGAVEAITTANPSPPPPRKAPGPAPRKGAKPKK